MSRIDVAEPLFEEEISGEVPVISRSRQTLTRLLANRPAMVGLAMLIIVVVLALIAPLIARYNPDAIDVSNLNQNPTPAHWFGTDYLGRDTWARLLYGARVSLPAGLGAVVISFCIGVAMGVTAGYGRKLVDDLLMRLVDMLLAFPGILLAIGIVTILGAGLKSAVIAVGVAGIPGYARIARGLTLQAREETYVLASRVVGGRTLRIMVRHILPNIAAPLVVLATLNLSGAILAASALSFLGLGTQPPTADWGTMLAQGYEHMFQSWAQVTFPGLLILFTVLGINLLGDGLGDALNPTLRGGAS
ncbi:MAG: ABC transporter permease [Chloroflexi bacterium]|nr:ABC transporter permease [Chloroflexota bacterium]